MEARGTTAILISYGPPTVAGKRLLATCSTPSGFDVCVSPQYPTPAASGGLVSVGFWAGLLPVCDLVTLNKTKIKKTNLVLSRYTMSISVVRTRKATMYLETAGLNFFSVTNHICRLPVGRAPWHHFLSRIVPLTEQYPHRGNHSRHMHRSTHRSSNLWWCSIRCFSKY